MFKKLKKRKEEASTLPFGSAQYATQQVLPAATTYLAVVGTVVDRFAGNVSHSAGDMPFDTVVETLRSAPSPVVLKIYVQMCQHPWKREKKRHQRGVEVGTS